MPTTNVLSWDDTGNRKFETGVDRGVLYPINSSGAYTPGVAWNGLTSVSESPSGAEATALWADNIKYLNLYSAEEFGATIEAYTYPKEWEACDGSAELSAGVTIGQQSRKKFGLCYRTRLGNDVDGDSYGYKLHLVYGCMASPSERQYSTVNDSPEAITFSWTITTTPVSVSDISNKSFKPTSVLTIDSTQVDATKLKSLEDVLYGISAPAFSATATYAVGDYVTYESKTYKCTTAVSTAGAWDASDWTEVEDPIPSLPLPDAVAAIFNAQG